MLSIAALSLGLWWARCWHVAIGSSRSGTLGRLRSDASHPNPWDSYWCCWSSPAWRTSRWRTFCASSSERLDRERICDAPRDDDENDGRDAAFVHRGWRTHPGRTSSPKTLRTSSRRPQTPVNTPNLLNGIYLKGGNNNPSVHMSKLNEI